ncbi:uncharacterized protein LOC142620359 [Castanea sativa]|uniref:uncharacterized protein LOC142620359 n=1 Tax=Castanea sativa TaxID=21020 RepID=UPI003F64A74E
MDATLEKLWKKFTLLEEEKGALSVNAQDVARSKEQAQFGLLFKLQTNKEFNKEAFKSTIQQLWRGSQRVTIKDVGNNIFLAIFETEEHMNDILDRSPWSFDKRLVMVKRFTNDASLENVLFQRSPFWIRVFNIPIRSMNAKVGRYIANEIGVPLLVDGPKSGLAWGPFLCIRVDIDITKPLMRGKMLQVEGMEEGWVHFKYERLPIYCYRCGILGHQERECNKAKRGCITVEEDDFQFRPWLRVVGTKSNQGKNSFNKTRSGVVEEDIDLESNEEEGGRQLSHISHRQRLKRKLDFQQGFNVPRVGLRGGLALLWRDNVEIDVQTSSPHHIDALINQNGVVWRFTRFYGHPETSKREEFWELMRQLHVSHSLPWLLIGDFNEILHSDEYWGSGSRPFHQIAEFTRVVDDCSLIDLGYRGPKFTWCNRRFEGNLVYARLDWGLHNLEWMQLFPQSKLSHVPFGFSDHMALLVKLQTDVATSPI